MTGGREVKGHREKIGYRDCVCVGGGDLAMHGQRYKVGL